MTERLRIEVVLAVPGAAHVAELMVPPGTTVLNVVERSRLAERVPGLDLAHCAFGVFGRQCGPAALVAAGDRVEVYRPLSADPKAQRRLRAARDR